MAKHCRNYPGKNFDASVCASNLVCSQTEYCHTVRCYSGCCKCSTYSAYVVPIFVDCFAHFGPGSCSLASAVTPDQTSMGIRVSVAGLVDRFDCFSRSYCIFGSRSSLSSWNDDSPTYCRSLEMYDSLVNEVEKD